MARAGTTAAAAPAAADKTIGPDKGAAGEKHAPAPFDINSPMRDALFDRLVEGEHDVIGLLAYSLAMQNKRDWFAAYMAAVGREPQASEVEAYNIGELIERRLATYRKLAENALAGNSFWASTALTPVSELPGVPDTSPNLAVVSQPPKAAAPGRNRTYAMPLLAGLIGIGAVAAFLAFQHLI